MSATFTAACLFLPVVLSHSTQKLFQPEQIIFASDFNITSIIVPADSNISMLHESSDIPNVFFTVSDPKLEGGSCIYVLQGLSAYEIIEGGRDTTSDFSSDTSIYFGTKNGIYIYDPDSLSAKKYGIFNDDIRQLQKANGTDAIYILTNENQLFKIESDGTKKSRVPTVACASEFVLDTSNNIYYIACGESWPRVLRSDGSLIELTTNIMDDFSEIKLLRPAFLMDKSVPFIADGDLYILYSNGTGEKKEFSMRERPSAYSVDAAIYILAALDGKIYEFNVMEVLLKSMFGLADGIGDLTKIILQLIDKAKDKNNIRGYHSFIK